MKILAGLTQHTIGAQGLPSSRITAKQGTYGQIFRAKVAKEVSKHGKNLKIIDYMIMDDGLPLGLACVFGADEDTPVVLISATLYCNRSGVMAVRLHSYTETISAWEDGKEIFEERGWDASSMDRDELMDMAGILMEWADNNNLWLHPKKMAKCMTSGMRKLERAIPPRIRKILKSDF